MSAGVFGANLLEEVQEESLDKLLYDLRYDIDPGTENPLGVVELDRLLDLFCHSHHRDRGSHVQDDTSASGAHHEHISELHSTTDAGISHSGKKRHRPILVELANTLSGNGSINLLYHITAASILPRKYRGKESTTVWLDTRISFSATRLYSVCINYLGSVDSSLPQSQRQNIAEDALRHVHVFSISSSKQLAAILDSLPDYLLQTRETTTDGSKHYSMHRPLSLIILDSATAFHWSDRFDAEIARLEAIRAPAPNIETQHQPQPQTPASAQTQQTPTSTRIITQLKALHSKFNNICIYTTTTPHPKPHAPSTRPHPSTTTTTTTTGNPNLPPRPSSPPPPPLSPWTHTATLSLTITRIPVPQFASHMSLDDCLQDRAKRQEVVRLNRMRVSVNEEWLGTVVRDKEMRRAVGRMDGRGGFVVRVNEAGVEIER